MKTIDKVMQCLLWNADNLMVNSEDYDVAPAKPKKVSETKIIYYDLEDDECVLNIVGEVIEFDGLEYTFEEFLMLLTGEDEYLIEEMLGEIELD